jgi:hypothetical protein
MKGRWAVQNRSFRLLCNPITDPQSDIESPHLPHGIISHQSRRKCRRESILRGRLGGFRLASRFAHKDGARVMQQAQQIDDGVNGLIQTNCEESRAHAHSILQVGATRRYVASDAVRDASARRLLPAGCFDWTYRRGFSTSRQSKLDGGLRGYRIHPLTTARRKTGKQIFS